MKIKLEMEVELEDVKKMKEIGKKYYKDATIEEERYWDKVSRVLGCKTITKIVRNEFEIVNL